VGACLFVVDSSPAVQRLVEYALASEPYEVMGFRDGISALDAAKRFRPELVFADYHLEGISFDAFCERLKRPDFLPDARIVSLANLSDSLDEERLRASGVQAFLKKPLQADHILQAVKEAGPRRGWAPAGTAAWPAEPVRRQDDIEAADIDRMLGWAPAMPAAGPGGRAEVAARPAVASSDFGGAPAPDQLRTLVEETLQQQVSELLPALIAREVKNYLGETIRAELAAQLSATLPREQMIQTVQEAASSACEEAVHDALPNIVSQQLLEMKASLQENVSASSAAMIRDLTDRLVRELAGPTLRKQLPELLKEQLGPIDALVREATEEATARYSRQAAEAVRDMGREVVKEVIEQVVREVVPELAKLEIKREIDRLTAEE
jgi:two-component system cell cycle response regulator DivK